MILADIELAAIAILSWSLGVFSMALWQNWRARPAPPIANELMPQPLVDDPECWRTPCRQSRQHGPDGRGARVAGTFSEFAPKRRVEPPAQKNPLVERARKLQHWPRAIPETEKPPAMVEARPRQVERPAQSIEPWHARDDLPKIEFGSGAKP
jgi:hypothetical protein